jgi:hypothetical protein
MKMNAKHEMVARVARWSLVLAAALAMMLSAAISRAQLTAASQLGPDGKSAAANAAFAPTPGARPATLATNVEPPPAGQTPSRGTHEGITAHGYWTIDVRDADGKLAKHLEFENQLCSAFVDPYRGGNVPGGASTLSSVLAGTASPGSWALVVGAPDTTPATNCAFSPYVYIPQLNPYGPAGILEGSQCVRNGFSCGSNYGFPLSLTCQFNNTGGFGFTFPGSNFITNHCENPLTESSSGTGITLSSQFGVSQTVTISAVGTELFTCSGTPGPPKPADCQNIGQNAANLLAVPNTPCSIYGSSPGAPNSSISFTGCLPGDTTSIVTIQTEAVANVPGRAPFSGVILTGTNGVPAPFTVSPGQTVAITWALSFQ